MTYAGAIVSVSATGWAWMMAYGWLELPPLAHAASSGAKITNDPIEDVFIAALKSRELRHYTGRARHAFIAGATRRASACAQFDSRT
jgi:hypothetical protein